MGFETKIATWAQEPEQIINEGEILNEASEHSAAKKAIKALLEKLERAADQDNLHAIRGLENTADKFLDATVKLSNKISAKI